MAQLRAHGRVEEVTPDELAMRHDEARALLVAAGVDVGGDALDDLVHQTEGWPVGLYLGALAIKAKGTTRSGVSIRGDDRGVADYLRAEVLSSLPPSVASFLARTSVLEHLCAPLCDAVLEANGSQQVLEALEASNLLLVPLDRQRRWYRYHHLFRDLLRNELQRSEPAIVGDLHARAAAWFEAQGQYELAIDHAQAAEDAERAARLCILNAQATYALGRFDTALRWLAWFEERNLLEDKPELAVLAAVADAVRGRAAAAERWADVAVAAAANPSVAGPRIDGWIAVMESVLFRHGVAQLRTDAETAVALLSHRSLFQATALHSEAMSYLFAGEPATADRLLADVVETSMQLGTTPATVMALGERAALAIDRHDWTAAEELTSQALAIIDEVRLGAYLQALIVYAVAARLAAHRGDVGQARHYVVLASRLRPLATAAIPMTAHMLLQVGRAYLELADPAGARAVLRQVHDIQQARPDLGTLAEGGRRARAPARHDASGHDRGVLAHGRRAPAPAVPGHPPLVRRDRRAALRVPQHREVPGRLAVPQARGVLAGRSRGQGRRDRPLRRRLTARRGASPRRGDARGRQAVWDRCMPDSGAAWDGAARDHDGRASASPPQHTRDGLGSPRSRRRRGPAGGGPT